MKPLFEYVEIPGDLGLYSNPKRVEKPCLRYPLPLGSTVNIVADSSIIGVPTFMAASDSQQRWLHQPRFPGAGDYSLPKKVKAFDLSPYCKQGWQLYRSVMNQPPEVKIGNIRMVTKAEKIRWKIRRTLVRWGVI